MQCVLRSMQCASIPFWTQPNVTLSLFLWLTCPPAFIFIYHFVIQNITQTPTHNPSVHMSHFCPSSVMDDPFIVGGESVMNLIASSLYLSPSLCLLWDRADV